MWGALRDVMKADISLIFSDASNCWTRQMKVAFDDLLNGTSYVQSEFLHYRKLNIFTLRIDLRFRHQAVWREALDLVKTPAFVIKICGLLQLVYFA
jgi:hypothetical protein